MYDDSLWDNLAERTSRRVSRTFDSLKPERNAGTLKERKAIELDGLLVAAKLLEERISKVTAQLKILDGFPNEDPYDDGDTIEFARDFPNGGKVYDYAARKIDGLWYVTGAKSPQGVTWEEFVSWLGLGLVGEIRLAKRTARKAPAKKATRKRAARLAEAEASRLFE